MRLVKALGMFPVCIAWGYFCGWCFDSTFLAVIFAAVGAFFIVDMWPWDWDGNDCDEGDEEKDEDDF